jgi:cation:H+ antiporter
MSAWIFVFLILVGGLAVWYCGTKLVTYVDLLGDKLHIGKAFLGALLLGGVTSLPELTTTIVASYLGNATLAVSNLLGGIAMQTTVLAAADLLLMKQALTFVAPQPVLIMSGVLLIFQLAFVIVCGVLGEFLSFYDIGLWSFLNFAIFILFLFILRKYEGKEKWVATGKAKKNDPKKDSKFAERQSTRVLTMKIILYALPVVGGGILITYGANRLVEITGLASDFMGASIVALTTSLPEITTTFNAIRIRAYTLAISNIFGSNALMIGVLLISDIFYVKGLIFNAIPKSVLFLSALGILVTAAYIWGLLERRDKTFLRMGIDSFVVILIEIGGLFVLYFI